MSNLIRSRASRITAVLATAAVSLGMFAGPAAAARDQTGLVIVNVEDTNVAVAVPVSAAIAACDLVDVQAAAVLAAAAANQRVECDADSGNATVDQTQQGPTRGGNQNPGPAQ